MTFAEWWESDEAFKVRHEDERTQAQAAWDRAVIEVRASLVAAHVCAPESAKDGHTYLDGYQDALIDVDEEVRVMHSACPK